MQPEPDYFALPHVSQSALKLFMKSPLEYKFIYVDNLGSGSETLAMALGSLVHCMLLEPNEVERRYAILDEDLRPNKAMTMAAKENKAWKEFWVNEAKEKRQLIVSKDVYLVADLMSAECCAHPLAVEYLYPDGSDWGMYTEQSIVWRHEGSELPLKSKLDRILVNLKDRQVRVTDYKTTSCSNLTDFGWSVKRYGYDIQAAFYEDAVRSFLETTYPKVALSEWNIELVFIPQKSTAPFQVLGVVRLDEETMRQARGRYVRALQELEGCLHTGQWNDSLEVHTLSLSKPVADVLLPDTEIILP